MGHRPYLPVELVLPDHPKTNALAKIWRCHPYMVVGFLVKLWGYCVEFQDDGNVDGCPADVLDILAAPCTAMSIGTIPTVREALQKVGFVDEGGQLHDWWEYAGALIERRRKDRRRKQLARKRSPEDRRQMSGGQNADRRGNSAPRVEQSRVEQTTEVAVADGRLAYVMDCTIACNAALHANPAIGDRCNELVATSQTAPLEWYAAGIPIAIADKAISAAALAYKPKERNPQPRDLRYFDAAVRDAFERSKQRAIKLPAQSKPGGGYEGTGFREAKIDG